VAKIRPTVKLERLRGLADQPAEQVDYALELVETEDNPDVVQAALDALADTPDARVRRALLDRFTRDADGAGGGDSDCYRRVALLQALRYRAQRDDASILERGVTTYEFKPPFYPDDPTRGDVAAGLRSVALVTLNEVDETLGGYHAARLLIDRYTSPMSGEPAVTAARVLDDAVGLDAARDLLAQPPRLRTQVRITIDVVGELGDMAQDDDREHVGRYVEAARTGVIAGAEARPHHARIVRPRALAVKRQDADREPPAPARERIGRVAVVMLLDPHHREDAAQHAVDGLIEGVAVTGGPPVVVAELDRIAQRIQLELALPHPGTGRRPVSSVSPAGGRAIEGVGVGVAQNVGGLPAHQPPD